VLRVLLASLVGRLPFGAAPLALLLFARESVSIAAAGLVVAAYGAGTAVGQPMLSRLADRRHLSPVLWAATGLSTAGFIVVAAGLGPVPTAVAALAAGLGAPPFEAGLRVLWKDLVRPELVHTGYTLDVTAQELIFIVGPLTTLAAIGLAGPVAGVIVCALVQLGGTAVFATAPAVVRWRGTPGSRHWAGPLRSSGLRRLLAATLLVGCGVGATTVAITAYAEAEGARSWAGWLLAAQATGALLGGLYHARRPVADPRRALPLLVAGLAVGYLPLLLTPPPLVMLLAMAVSGLALPPALTAVFITADAVTLPGTAAETFAWVATAFAIGSAAGSAVDGLLLEGARPVVLGFVLAPLVIAAAGGLLWHGLPRHGLREPIT
jgi:predicted MFS family arabinose efflux permease